MDGNGHSIQISHSFIHSFSLTDPAANHPPNPISFSISSILIISIQWKFQYGLSTIYDNHIVFINLFHTVILPNQVISPLVKVNCSWAFSVGYLMLVRSCFLIISNHLLSYVPIGSTFLTLVLWGLRSQCFSTILSLFYLAYCRRVSRSMWNSFYSLVGPVGKTNTHTLSHIHAWQVYWLKSTTDTLIALFASCARPVICDSWANSQNSQNMLWWILSHRNICYS